MRKLEDEAMRLTGLLRGRAVKVVKRHRSTEVLVEFDDGVRLYVNAVPDGLESSVTATSD